MNTSYSPKTWHTYGTKINSYGFNVYILAQTSSLMPSTDANMCVRADTQSKLKNEIDLLCCVCVLFT